MCHYLESSRPLLLQILLLRCLSFRLVSSLHICYIFGIVPQFFLLFFFLFLSFFLFFPLYFSLRNFYWDIFKLIFFPLPCLGFWWTHQRHSAFLLQGFGSSISVSLFLRVSVAQFTLPSCSCMIMTFSSRFQLIVPAASPPGKLISALSLYPPLSPVFRVAVYSETSVLWWDFHFVQFCFSRCKDESYYFQVLCSTELKSEAYCF